jgi:hypothetical protein
LVHSAVVSPDREARHYHPQPAGSGPSWLTFLGHLKDSLGSVDVFRCEPLGLRSYWVLLVMDQCCGIAAAGRPASIGEHL